MGFVYPETVLVLFLSAVFLLLGGCAGLTTSRADCLGVADQTNCAGARYYLPKRDITVSVKIDDKGIPSVQIGATPYYPDVEEPLYLQQNQNLFGTSDSTLEIGANGLLSSSKSVVTSSVTEAAIGLGNLAGQISAFREAKNAPDCVSLSIFLVLDPDEPVVIPELKCDLKVEIDKLAGQKFVASTLPGAPKSSDGVFYRQQLPYRVKVLVGEIPLAQSVILSPSYGPVGFLPVQRSFFADSTNEFSFDDGVLRKSAKKTDGEIIGAIALPAKLIAAYFEGIGSIFGNFKKADDSEAASLASEQALLLATRKFEACIESLRTGEDEAIAELCD